MSNKKIEQSVIDSITSDKLSSLASDTAEIALDSILDDGVLKEIPIFGTLVNIYHAASNIKEGLFARKIYKFLSEISKLSTVERQKVVDEIISKKGGTQAAGLTIVSLIDKIDDEKKSEFIGKLFIDCAKGNITVDQLLRISNIISITYIDDINHLINIKNILHFSNAQKNAYVASGLMLLSIEKPNYLKDEYSLQSLSEEIFIGLTQKKFSKFPMLLMPASRQKIEFALGPR